MKLLVEKKELWCKFVPETNKDIAIHNLNVLAWNACRQAQKELLDKELTVERLVKVIETFHDFLFTSDITDRELKDAMLAQAIIKELKS